MEEWSAEYLIVVEEIEREKWKKEPPEEEILPANIAEEIARLQRILSRRSARRRLSNARKLYQRLASRLA